MKVWKPRSSYSLGREIGWDPLMDEVHSCLSEDAIWTWWRAFLVERHRDYPEVWVLALREACEAHADYLNAQRDHAELDDAFRATVGAPGDLTSAGRTDRE